MTGQSPAATAGVASFNENFLVCRLCFCRAVRQASRGTALTVGWSFLIRRDRPAKEFLRDRQSEGDPGKQ